MEHTSKSVLKLLRQTGVLRSYCTNSRHSYSHLLDAKHGLWRDDLRQHTQIGEIVKDIDAIAENTMKLSTSDTSAIVSPTGGYLSASSWPVEALGHLRMFWRPTNDVDLVLPKECEPSDQDMARYQTFLSPEKDRDFFMSPAAWSFSDTFDDGLASSVALSLYNLLQAKGRTRSGDIAEDKVEAYTDDFFGALRYYMKVERPVLGEDLSFNILRNESITGTLFGGKYTARPEFALEDRRGTLQAFIEKRDDTSSEQNKRLGFKHDEFADTIGQKAAEALAIATRRIKRGEKPCEVFGIGIRHFYFTFWHASFSPEYLRSVRSGQRQWQGDEHLVIKSFPYSQFGLDFCDPSQRKDILCYIHRILNYLKVVD